MDIAVPTLAVANANLGLTLRYQFSKTSGIIEVVEPIFFVVSFAERLLLCYADVKVFMNCTYNGFLSYSV